MPSPDTLATIALAAAMALAVLAICRTEPGAAAAWLERRRRAAAYHRAGKARHTSGYLTDATTPMPAVAKPAPTLPDIRQFTRTA